MSTLPSHQIDFGCLGYLSQNRQIHAQQNGHRAYRILSIWILAGYFESNKFEQGMLDMFAVILKIMNGTKDAGVYWELGRC